MMIEDETSQGSIQLLWNDIKHKMKEPAKPRKPSKPADYRYASVDVYQGIEDTLDTLEKTKEVLFNNQKSWPKKIGSIFRMNESWIFLTLLGFICAMVVLACETAMQFLIDLRVSWSSWESLGFVGNYIVWIILGIFFAFITTACVRYISPHSSGSGIPAMKSILSGLILHQYLSFRCLVSKIIGIVACYGGGLAAGKEGPYVHICAILAYQLAKIPIFSKIRKNQGLKIQMLAAGCAAGMAVTFGAPVSGVLFSIETTSTYYLISNLWKAFLCAISATFLVKLLGNTGLLALFSTHFETSPYSPLELLFFCLLGIFYGVLGALFVKFVQFIGQSRRRFKILQRPYFQAFFMALVTALVSFPLDIMRGGPTKIINQLFTEKSMEGWDGTNLFLNLTLITSIKFVLSATTIGMPIVAGLFTPVFTIGAASGRLIGEIVAVAFPSLGVIPGGYAVVGAAAFSAGVTRTVAPGLIVFETTGQLTHLLPVLLTVLISSTVGNFFTASIYDVLLKEKGLPYMPIIRRGNELKKPVKSLMRKDLEMVTVEMTFLDIHCLLKKSGFRSYPLVDNKEKRIFLGQIQRHFLEEKLFEHERRFKRLLNDNVDIDEDKYINTGTSAFIGIKNLIPFNINPKRTKEHEEQELESNIQIQMEGNKDSNVSPPSREEFFSQKVGLGNLLDLSDQSNEDWEIIEGFDPCPFTVAQTAPLSKVHFMFAILGLVTAWVVQGGKLVGVITKKDLMKEGDEM